MRPPLLLPYSYPYPIGFLPSLAGGGVNCPFRPTQLAQMLHQHEQLPPGYNELILDPASWSAHLPETILGVFYVQGSGDRCVESRGDLIYTLPALSVKQLLQR